MGKTISGRVQSHTVTVGGKKYKYGRITSKILTPLIGNKITIEVKKVERETEVK